MIAQNSPASGFLILDGRGTPLGRIELPREPEVRISAGTVLLRRAMPSVAA
ncbi:MAG: hypothetical protein M3N43_00335 [Actinomycetota bacterium]|nr:hypothetical protein [Actinomycetota bacterium]